MIITSEGHPARRLVRLASLAVVRAEFGRSMDETRGLHFLPSHTVIADASFTIAHLEERLKRTQLFLAMALAISLLLGIAPSAAQPAGASPAGQALLDYDIPGGHFFTQANGLPLGASPLGYSVTNSDDVPFWDAFVAFGGEHVVGYPVTRRFVYDGFVTQAMQKMVFQYRPDTGQVWFLNTFDALHDKDKDDWLLVYRQTPKPFDTSPDAGLSWQEVLDRHLAMLDTNDSIKQAYLSDPSFIDHYGLPVAYADMGNSFVLRAQRATFQYWKESVPWARAGEVSIANGGDLAKEAGLWPEAALVPEQAPAATASHATGAIAPRPVPRPAPRPVLGPLPAPLPLPLSPLPGPPPRDRCPPLAPRLTGHPAPSTA